MATARRPRSETRGRFDALRALCRLLASELRQTILIVVAHQPLDVDAIAQATGGSTRAVRTQLKKLVDNGLLSVRKVSGRQVFEATDRVVVLRKGPQSILRVIAADGGSLTICKPAPLLN